MNLVQILNGHFVYKLYKPSMKLDENSPWSPEVINNYRKSRFGVSHSHWQKRLAKELNPVP